MHTRILLTLLTYFALPILKKKTKQINKNKNKNKTKQNKTKQNKTKQKTRIYLVWFLFGRIPGVDPYSRHFGTKNSKIVSKI